MKVELIRTPADHDAALREVECLWGAADGPPEGDRLEVLIALVEAYERAHYPIEAPDPIEAIEFRHEQQRTDPR